MHPSSDGHPLPCRAAFSLFRPSRVPANQVARVGRRWKAWISTHSCLPINSSEASRNGFVPATASQGASEVGEMSSEVYWDTERRLLQGFGWGASRALWALTPHGSPSSSTLGLAASLWLPGSGTPSRSTYCPLRVAGPPARPGVVPWRWRQPGNVGGDPRGRGGWTEASVWSCWGPFPGPRPMTACLRMPPIIQLTEHKGATRALAGQAPGMGAWGSGSPLQRARMCPESRGQLSRRNENHFLQPPGDKDREK